MVLLDLDAAGLDPRAPAPPELIQFLYDNSRSGYLTLWSAILAEPDGAPTIQRWLDNALQIYYSRSLLTQMAPAGDKPAGEGITEVTYAGPTAPPAPVCVDVPFVQGSAAVGAELTCTMGNWGNEPVSYAYAWSTGSTNGTYVVTEADAGASITCVVSATNAGGTTAAPPSNAIVIPTGAATQARSSRRDYPKEEAKEDEKPTTGSGPVHRDAHHDARRDTRDKK
jgi:hypothetical protein